jgi:hypothetical protein
LAKSEIGSSPELLETLSYRKLLEEKAEGTGYEITFELSGEGRPETGLAKAHPYSWEFALQASRDFPNAEQAVVRIYFPSKLVRIAEYQPQTARKEKIAEISANLLPQLTITVPVFKVPPVSATDQRNGDNHFVEWQFDHITVDRKFRSLLKGVAVVYFYERKYRTGFTLKAYAMAKFRGRGILRHKDESLTLSRESEKIKPRTILKKQTS